MSPLLKGAEEAGIKGMRMKRMPSDLTTDDFFAGVNRVRVLFNQLINGPQENRVVLGPSASYLIANAAQNASIYKGSNIVMLAHQFPSNYYVWQKRAHDESAELKIVEKPTNLLKSWTNAVIDAIDDDTAVVTLPTLHWGDGTLLDLVSISRKCKTVNALLIVDGTQSIGALSFDQSKVQADAIIASTYKWLLGPYGSAIGFFGDAFDNGRPIEDSWLNRKDSHDFQYLTNYQDQYREGARRYEVGEAPDFVKVPMIEYSLNQLLKWTPDAIQGYCKTLIEPIIAPLKNVGYQFSPESQVAFHLLGIRLPDNLTMDKVKEKITRSNISLSYRQDAVRLSPNVYNSEKELQLLKKTLVDIAK